MADAYDCPACGGVAIGCRHRPRPTEALRLGQLLREERERAGLGLNEAARRLGLSAAWLSRVELARHGAGVPSSARLTQLAELYGVDKATCDHWHRIGGRLPADVLETLLTDERAFGRVREARRG